MKKGTEGKVVDIVNPRRVDVQFPPIHRPAKYHAVKILDGDDTILAKATVWKDRDSGWIWKDRDDGWVRCWGPTDGLRPGLKVIDTGRIDYKRKYLDIGSTYLGHFLKSLGLPKSDLEEWKAKAWPPLDDPKLLEILNEIMDGVVNKLGYRAAMLSTYENGELPVRVFRIKEGWEWLWEWGVEFVGVSIVGQTLILKDYPDILAVKTAERALRGESDVHAITKSLYDLWGYMFDKDRLLVWALQRLAGIRSIINIPFCAKGESGELELVGNMYAGHSKGKLTEKDIAAFHAFVGQASLAVQNARLYRVAQERAVEAETLAGMADFGARMAHRMINELGIVRPRLKRLIKRKKEEEQEDVSVLEEIYESVKTALEMMEEMKRPFRKVRKELTDVNNCIDSALALCTIPRGIEVEKSEGLKRFPKVEADQNLTEVFRILIKNAYEAMGETGVISINGEVMEQRWARVSVSDTGPGIPPEARDKLFELFYTTKESEGGFGLGLWWARTYLRRLGGNIEVSPLGNGATFMMKLPLAERTA